jgi:uncharacterized membrane protein
MSQSNERLELIKAILEDDTIAAEEEAVLHMLLTERVSTNAISEHEEKLTAGQRAADRVAQFAGSWGFILAFFVVLAVWIAANAFFLASLGGKPFDPYPFILMNLILSCIAALQAPVIMMSQNRQEEKDRARSKNDYKVNLKSEIIIEDLHEKLDQILETQKRIAERLEQLERPKR